MKDYKIETHGNELVIDLQKVDVYVMPYIIKDKLLNKIGVHSRKTKNRLSDLSYTLLSDFVLPEDTSYLYSAKRILDKVGYDEIPDENWTFLGIIFLSKEHKNPAFLYGVNISDINPNNEQENIENFQLMSGGNAITMSNESVLLATYLRLFDFFYQNNK